MHSVVPLTTTPFPIWFPISNGNAGGHNKSTAVILSVSLGYRKIIRWAAGLLRILADWAWTRHKRWISRSTYQAPINQGADPDWLADTSLSREYGGIKLYIVPWAMDAVNGPIQCIQWYGAKWDPTIAAKHRAGLPAAMWGRSLIELVLQS